MRSNDSFDMFWNTVTKRSKELKVNDPCLPRNRQRRLVIFLGMQQLNFLQIHRKIITGICIFRQLIQSSPSSKKYSIKLDATYTGYRKLEELLLSAVNGEPYCSNLRFLCRFYEGDIDEFQLEAQLSLFATHFREVNSHNSQVSINDILKYFKDLTTAQKKLMFQVAVVVKLLLLAPCTNAVSDRSCSALRRVKTYLQYVTWTTFKFNRNQLGTVSAYVM